MPTSPRSFRPSHQPKASERTQQSERDRGSAASRGYDRGWQAAALQYRAEHPLCEYCEAEGRVSAASCVDHLYPHRGNRFVFWFRAWWVSSCDGCHSGMKQRIEREGLTAIDRLAHRQRRPLWYATMKGMPPQKS